MNLSKNLSFNHPKIGTLDNVGIAHLEVFYHMPNSMEKLESQLSFGINFPYNLTIFKINSFPHIWNQSIMN